MGCINCCHCSKMGIWFGSMFNQDEENIISQEDLLCYESTDDEESESSERGFYGGLVDVEPLKWFYCAICLHNHPTSVGIECGTCRKAICMSSIAHLQFKCFKDYIAYSMEGEQLSLAFDIAVEEEDMVLVSELHYQLMHIASRVARFSRGMYLCPLCRSANITRVLYQ